MPKFTIATATYNRANTLFRVFESLNNQTYRNFEWIIVDDGSTDETANVVKAWVEQADFPIRYCYQENSGKHMAINLAVELAKGELFVIADSDDTFKPKSLELLLRHWEDIPAEKRDLFRGVTCRCYDSLTSRVIGCDFPGTSHDVLGIDAKFKYHYCFEMWGFNRTDVMKEFPFPDTSGEGLSYYPETVIWDQMGMKYNVRFVNDTLRAYYRDQKNATTAKNRSRSKENIHLWAHYINRLLGYFINDPMQFIKASIGLSMDGLLLQKSFLEILQIPNTAVGKALVILFFPVGYVLYSRRK